MPAHAVVKPCANLRVEAQVSTVPSRLGSNLRKGHRGEGVGVELLRAIGAVAPVPQPEDIGVDAVVTLLRPDGSLLHAEDSFFVQLKTINKRVVEYVDSEYAWARALQLPLFLGIVDGKRGTICLYSTHRALQRTDWDAYRGVRMSVDQVAREVNDDVVKIWLGPPVLSWTLSEAWSADFQGQAYRVMKKWIELLQQNIAHRGINRVAVVSWEENQEPVPTGAEMYQGHPSRLPDDMRAALPALVKLHMHVAMSDQPHEVEAALLILTNWMREAGVTEYDSVIKAFLAHKLSRRAREQ